MRTDAARTVPMASPIWRTAPATHAPASQPHTPLLPASQALDIEVHVAAYRSPTRTIFSPLLTMYPPPLNHSIPFYHTTLHTTDKLRPRSHPHPPTSDPSSRACTEHVAHRAVSIAYHRARPSRAINEDSKKKKKLTLCQRVQSRYLVSSLLSAFPHPLPPHQRSEIAHLPHWMSRYLVSNTKYYWNT